MTRYLAAHRKGDTIEPHGYVEADDALAATLQAQKRWPGCGVMPPKAVHDWERRGGALQSGFKQRVDED